MTVWGLLIALALAAYLAAWLYTSLMFDRLLEIEYNEHREAWEGDGRPFGFFFRPPEVRFWQSGFAFHRVSFSWSWRRPHWLCGPEAETTYRRFRISLFTGWGLVAVIMVAVVLIDTPS